MDSRGQSPPNLERTQKTMVNKVIPHEAMTIPWHWRGRLNKWNATLWQIIRSPRISSEDRMRLMTAMVSDLPFEELGRICDSIKPIPRRKN